MPKETLLKNTISFDCYHVTFMNCQTDNAEC